MLRITELVQLWVKDVALSASTLDRYVCSLTLAVRSGIKCVEDLTRDRVKVFLAERREAGATLQTCNHDVAAIQSFARWLEGRGLMTFAQVNELRRLKLKVGARPPVRFLVREEYGELVGAALDLEGDLAELAIALGVHTGMRLGEIQVSHAEHYRLEHRAPDVLVHGTKNARSFRRAAIAPSFAAWLAKHPAFPEKGPVFPAHGTSGRGRPSCSPYLQRLSFQRWLRSARAAVGLRDVTWLVLRHTYGTWLAEDDWPLHKIARWMGNTARIVETHYLGHVPGGDEGIESAFADPPELEDLDEGEASETA